MASESDKGAKPPPQREGSPGRSAQDRRLADRRQGIERRQPHHHYDDLTPHPRPDRNINDYPLNTDEIEFINALEDYKRKFNRPFPSWSEVLHVLKTLGYDREGIISGSVDTGALAGPGPITEGLGRPKTGPILASRPKDSGEVSPD